MEHQSVAQREGGAPRTSPVRSPLSCRCAVRPAAERASLAVNVGRPGSLSVPGLGRRRCRPSLVEVCLHAEGRLQRASARPDQADGRAVARRASGARPALVAGGVPCPGTPREAVSRPRPRQRPQRGSQAPAAGWRARQAGAKRTAHRLKRSHIPVRVVLPTRMA